MKRFTLARLGELQIGDRFCERGVRKTWQIEAQIGKKKTSIQQYSINDEPILPYPIMVSADKQVTFLHHTKPQPGQSCYLKFLPVGSIFYMPDNVVKEYIVLKHIYNMNEILCSSNGNPEEQRLYGVHQTHVTTSIGPSNPINFSNITEVVFVK